ncbi:MAG: 30S ribosomal protein S12 methylthiotransferase RimO [Planctomycetia bacterium]|nr:30S ribosomal protein S12 methylthiotransferase RimO [Planctomycetia bacterium]
MHSTSQHSQSGAAQEAAISPKTGAVRTCSITSLGCPKNLVDSESMIGRLLSHGFELVEEAPSVDLLLVNTCGFLREATQEAKEVIAEACALKEAGAVGKLLVAGCAVVSDGKALRDEFPLVDVWVSPYDEVNIAKIVAALFADSDSDAQPSAATSASPLPNLLPMVERPNVEATRAEAKFYYDQAKSIPLDSAPRAALTEPHVAYVKIADGCDRFCSYCTIPKIRGRYASKPMEAILEELRKLADTGVREVNLIAQETTFWGMDLYGQPQLAKLLREIQALGLFDWVRTLYTYPLYWTKELTELFALQPQGTTSILPYIDVPLQHCNSEILKQMNRRVDKAQTIDLIEQLRAEIPNVVLRSSWIVGFPGETDKQYQELADFIEKYRFERSGVFEFSPEPGAPAEKMPNQVDPKVKHTRYERLYAKQERVSRQYARGLIGQIRDVILDARQISETGVVMKNVCVGRTYADAPDVDPVVYVTGRNLEPGSIIPCEIVDAHGLDLIAVPADPDKLFVTKKERKIQRLQQERENAENEAAQNAKPKRRRN